MATAHLPAVDTPPEDPRPAPAPADRSERVLDALAAVVTLGFLGLIAAQAGAARFFTDECFHAWVARWIAAHGTLPREIPELYSGFAYAYPPLFHLAGALAVRVGGAGALPWVNPALTAAMLAVLAFLPPREVGRAARRWAVLITAGSAAVATFALRFYAEAALAALAAAAALLFLRFASGGRRVAAGLGVVLGLAVATKTSALALLALPGVAGAVALARGERAPAGRALVALATALAVAAPVLIRNQVLFGSALYPAFAPDLDPALWRLHLERFGLTPGAFHARVIPMLAPALAVAAAGLALHLARRGVPRPAHAGAAVGLVLFGLAALLAAPALPVHDPRHVLPLLPVLATAGAALLAPALAPRARRAVEAGLLGFAVLGLAWLPGLRARLDPPKELVPAYRAVADHVPEGGTVLSLWTYDTFYWSGRAATWPVPWGQARRPLSPLLARDGATVVRELDRHGIDAVLAPRASRAERFDGSNYPRDFVLALGEAVEAGSLRVAWSNERLVLLVRR
jgi:hypothetical protein